VREGGQRFCLESERRQMVEQWQHGLAAAAAAAAAASAQAAAAEKEEARPCVVQNRNGNKEQNRVYTNEAFETVFWFVFCIGF